MIVMLGAKIEKKSFVGEGGKGRERRERRERSSTAY